MTKGTMTTTNDMWRPEIITLPCEHRLFQATDLCMKRSLPSDLRVRSDDALGAWAVADNSGGWPEQTDDGILWLNQRQNIKLGNDPSNPLIPILSPDGKAGVFVTNAAGLIVLSDMFRWNINVYPGNIYRAIRL